MNKALAALAIAAGLSTTMAMPAVAADLSNASGQSCVGGTGTWHFVNNQTGLAGAGTLHAVFNDGAITVTVGASKVLQNTQHFYVTTEGGATLTSATTDLAGRLVLSDFTCDDDDKKDPKS